MTLNAKVARHVDRMMNRVLWVWGAISASLIVCAFLFSGVGAIAGACVFAIVTYPVAVNIAIRMVMYTAGSVVAELTDDEFDELDAMIEEELDAEGGDLTEGSITVSDDFCGRYMDRLIPSCVYVTSAGKTTTYNFHSVPNLDAGGNVILPKEEGRDFIVVDGFVYDASST